MAPFPETEIMTIQRLQVALRKMDLKLLKDGAYKLHEKYHSGFKFEYIDLLKEIFIVSGVEISNNRRNDDVEVDIGVKVSKADGEKCERCWSYSPTVGTIKLYPTLCEKCVNNLK